MYFFPMLQVVRYGKKGSEKWGLWRLGMIVPVDLDLSMESFADPEVLRALEAVPAYPERSLNPENTRRGAPVLLPSKIICLAKNYPAHARELDGQPPSTPILFGKASSAITGPFDPVILPTNSAQVDWEVELVVVIGAMASHIPESLAYDVIAGYTLGNDLTARDQQKADGQFYRAKSADTFAPLGPFFVPRNYIPNPHQLRLWSKVNGRIQQSASTGEMFFPIPKIISFISESITLLPGDLIFTGTPAGVGAGKPVPQFLQPGDLLETGLEPLGVQQNPVQPHWINRR
jgi:2-keto-4-pentenoate hydratase/2-oxohepta-3-ene-1,7-dioic acid hydratase in catechol pathway